MTAECSFPSDDEASVAEDRRWRAHEGVLGEAQEGERTSRSHHRSAQRREEVEAEALETSVCALRLLV